MKKYIDIHAAEGGDDSKMFVEELSTAYMKFASKSG
jgi:protein subunit release factor A